MSDIDTYPVTVDSDSIADHIQQIPPTPYKEIPLFLSENVHIHIPAQCSATKEEIQVRGTLKLVHKNVIRVQWFPLNITTEDLTCYYSHDPSDDWEDLLTDLNATEFTNGDRQKTHTKRSDSSPNHLTDRAAYLASRELTLPATNGDPNMSLKVKSETLLPTNRSSKSNNISPGFVNIVATPLCEDRERGSSFSNPNKQYPIQFAHYNNPPTTTPNKKTTHVFTIKSPVHTGNPLDNAIANMGNYSEMDSDAVYLEREQAKIPDVKSVVVDFPLAMLFSVKEISAVSSGGSKSFPAIRFNLKGTRPTQNLYFHSGKGTLIKFFEELHQHIVLFRHDEDPTLLMTEGEDFAGNSRTRMADQRTYLQIASSKATDIMSEINKFTKIGAFMNAQFPKTTNSQFYTTQAARATPPPKSEEDTAVNNLSDVMSSIPFLEQPNFDLLPLLQSVEEKKRGIPLSKDDWELFCNKDGSVSNPSYIRRIIFEGGVTPELRPMVWLYLLDYYRFSDSAEQRENFINNKENEYLVMRSQWKTLSEGQIKRNKPFYKAKTIIGKDTVRTDREHPYFAGENNSNLDVLQDILLTHVMYDFDLGYVQGMSDILSPILIVLNHEIEAFWCFAHYMCNLHDNFANTTSVLNSKMTKFKDLLKFVDPPFCAFLRENDTYGFNIFFRWLLIDFKREFSLDDVLKLWEVLWTEHLTPDYNLFIALSMLLQMRQKIMEQELESEFSIFDNIFKMINDAAGDFDVDRTLLLAEVLYTKMINCPNLPTEIIPFFPTYTKSRLGDSCTINTDYSPEMNFEVEEFHFA